MEQQNYEVGGDLLQALLNYLATRPYAEVFKMVSALQQVKPIEVKEEKTSE